MIEGQAYKIVKGVKYVDDHGFEREIPDDTAWEIARRLVKIQRIHCRTCQQYYADMENSGKAEGDSRNVHNP